MLIPRSAYAVKVLTDSNEWQIIRKIYHEFEEASVVAERNKANNIPSVAFPYYYYVDSDTNEIQWEANTMKPRRI